MLLGGTIHMARYTGNHCPVCEQAFTDEDDIVVCPDCGTPYHRACWQKVGACMHQSEHAAGFEWTPEFGPEADAAAHAATCPNCGTHNAPGATRCSHCGVPLPRPEDAQSQDTVNQGSGPIYARNPGSYNPNSGTGARTEQGPHIDAFGAGMAGGIYRREVGPEDPIDGIKAKHWAIFLGRSPMYYLMQFFRMSETKRRVTFSFSAFFFGPAYLLYRKMWKEGILAALLLMLCYLPGLISMVVYYNPDFFGSMPLGWVSVASTIGEIVGWGLRVVLALFSVSLYEKHAKTRIEAVCARCPEGPERTQELARSGGTNVLAAVLYFGIMALVEVAFLYMAGPSLINLLMYEMSF